MVEDSKQYSCQFHLPAKIPFSRSIYFRDRNWNTSERVKCTILVQQIRSGASSTGPSIEHSSGSSQLHESNRSIIQKSSDRN